MGVYDFLGGLPAVLGIAGFFAYLWAGQSRIGGDLFREIVAKLRAAPNLDMGEYSKLTPVKIGKLIQTDARVRGTVNDQDQKLLRLLIIFQHIVTVIVLLVCAALVGASIWLMTRPQPLSVSVKGPATVSTGSNGMLVDLDAIAVDWTSTGRNEPVAVFLENVDSGKTTPKKNVASDVRSVRFEPEDVLQAATIRDHGKSNRIRAVIEWSTNRSFSEIKDVTVGINVELMLFGRLVTPTGKPRTIHTLLATIDQSTQSFPAGYCFNVDFVGWTKTKSAFVIPLRACDADGETQIPQLENVDWSRKVGLVYNGPDDPRIVKIRISGVPGSVLRK